MRVVLNVVVGEEVGAFAFGVVAEVWEDGEGCCWLVPVLNSDLNSASVPGLVLEASGTEVVSVGAIFEDGRSRLTCSAPAPVEFGSLPVPLGLFPLDVLSESRLPFRSINCSKKSRAGMLPSSRMDWRMLHAVSTASRSAALGRSNAASIRIIVLLKM